MLTSSPPGIRDAPRASTDSTLTSRTRITFMKPILLVAPPFNDNQLLSGTPQLSNAELGFSVSGGPAEQLYYAAGRYTKRTQSIGRRRAHLRQPLRTRSPGSERLANWPPRSALTGAIGCTESGRLRAAFSNYPDRGVTVAPAPWQRWLAVLQIRRCATSYVCGTRHAGVEPPCDCRASNIGR